MFLMTKPSTRLGFVYFFFFFPEVSGGDGGGVVEPFAFVPFFFFCFFCLSMPFAIMTSRRYYTTSWKVQARNSIQQSKCRTRQMPAHHRMGFGFAPRLDISRKVTPVNMHENPGRNVMRLMPRLYPAPLMFTKNVL